MKTDGNHRNRFEFRLDQDSGVPVYRQIIDQVLSGVAAGSLRTGTQLPTVRQLAVDLSVNPNTVIRAYRELEIRGILETQQGTGTFISQQKVKRDDADHERRLAQFAADCLARAGAAGFTARELKEALEELQAESNQRRK